MKIAIDEAGIITMIYDDEFIDLYDEGNTHITRVSSVEPTIGGQWKASMRDGTVLGPYRLRQEALDAEVKYLEAKLFS